jgi:tetratricopeptide (TPR) repeat protein
MSVNSRLLSAIEDVAHRFSPRATPNGPGEGDEHARLAAALREITRDASPDAMYAAAEHFRDRPDVALPLLEDVVQAQPNNSQALVRLANCYWLLGAGPQPVGELASRAIAVDPGNRAAWHLWALAEQRPRDRVGRWQQVATRFPEDDLALANVADNAASVAGAERDYDMVDIAIAAYDALRSRARREDERAAVDRALETLRGWKF